MKLNTCIRPAAWLAFIAWPFCMTGCMAVQKGEIMTTVKASLDFAENNEHGQSQLSYDAKTGKNIMTWVEYQTKNGNVIAAVDNGLDLPAEPATTPFTIGVGLEYIGKGNKLMGTKTHLNYLEIPALLLYHYPLSDKGTLYGGAGPYLAYGLGGKIKGQNYTEKSFSKDNYKRFDGGLEFMAGYKLPIGLSLDLAYDFGLANIAHGGDDFTSRNRCLSINLGYSLDKLLKGK